MGNVLVVFTAKGARRIESEGGTSNWSLSRRTMRDCQYVVCTRNTDPANVGDFGDQTPVPHGAAFLVGKVCGLEETYARNGRQRYRVLVNEVAEVLVPDFWDGSRIPTRYMSIEEAGNRGIYFDSLDYQKVSVTQSNSQDQASSEEAVPSLMSLSISEAKAGLATRFGVSIDDIDIVIRG